MLASLTDVSSWYLSEGPADNSAWTCLCQSCSVKFRAWWFHAAQGRSRTITNKACLHNSIVPGLVQGIERRDGYPADPDHVYITDGASQGVHAMMRLLIRDERDAILTPIPQYPLYSATIALYGGYLLPYYLDEDHAWELDVQQLRDQLKKVGGLLLRKGGTEYVRTDTLHTSHTRPIKASLSPG